MEFYYQIYLNSHVDPFESCYPVLPMKVVFDESVSYGVVSYLRIQEQNVITI